MRLNDGFHCCCYYCRCLRSFITFFFIIIFFFYFTACPPSVVSIPVVIFAAQHWIYVKRKHNFRKHLLSKFIFSLSFFVFFFCFTVILFDFMYLSKCLCQHQVKISTQTFEDESNRRMMKIDSFAKCLHTDFISGAREAFRMILSAEKVFERRQK